MATPYASTFDHIRAADEVQYAFDRCYRVLQRSQPELDGLPVFGVGHSLGSLLHLLIGARYAFRPRERLGNVLISFNNKQARDAVPILIPELSPLIQLGMQKLS